MAYFYLAVLQGPCKRAACRLQSYIQDYASQFKLPINSISNFLTVNLHIEILFSIQTAYFLAKTIYARNMREMLLNCF